MNDREIVEIVQEKLECENEAIVVKFVKEGLVGLECDCLETRMRMFQNKHKLKGSDIWMEDDHTKREIRIQRWIRGRAWNLRDEGNCVTVGYMKLMVNEECWVFNERVGELEKKLFRRREK